MFRLESEKISNSILKWGTLRLRMQIATCHMGSTILRFLPRTLYPYPHCTKQKVALRNLVKLPLQCQYLPMMPWGVWELWFLKICLAAPTPEMEINLQSYFLVNMQLMPLVKKSSRGGQSPAKYFLCVAFYCIVLKKSNVTLCVLS